MFRLIVAIAVLMLPLASPAEEACPHVQTLARVEDEASSRAPEILLARNAVEQAEADLAIAGERPNPSLTAAVGGYNPRSGLGAGPISSKILDASLHLDHPLERGGKRNLRRIAAGFGIEAARADLAEQRRQSLLTAQAAFYNLLLAQQDLDVDREIAALQADSVRALEQRLTDGDVSAADVARVQVEALKADNDVRQAQGALEGARTALAYVIGCGADDGFTAAGEWPSLSAAESAEADVSARADIVAASARARQASENLKLAQAQRTRDISVGLEIASANGTNSADGDLVRARPVFGVDVTIPLFLYHRYDGEIARAQADSDSARLQLQREQAQAGSEIAQARSALSAAADVARRQHEEILPQAQQAAQAIEYAYRRGSVPLLDLLDARRTLRQARLDVIQTQNLHAKAVATWRAATQRYAAAGAAAAPTQE